MAEKQQVTRIFDILKRQGRSKAWFARQVGINRSQLYQINWGERPMPRDFASRAAEVLQVPEDMLFYLPSQFPKGKEKYSKRNRQNGEAA